MTDHDLERIAKAALRDLGAGEVTLTVSTVNAGDWREIVVAGTPPRLLRIRAGEGTSAQYVREQIFAQFERR